VMKSLRGCKPIVLGGPLDSPYHAKTYTLREYYSKSQARRRAAQ
jgi:hypothetical protein